MTEAMQLIKLIIFMMLIYFNYQLLFLKFVKICWVSNLNPSYEAGNMLITLIIVMHVQPTLRNFGI